MDTRVTALTKCIVSVMGDVVVPIAYVRYYELLRQVQLYVLRTHAAAQEIDCT